MNTFSEQFPHDFGGIGRDVGVIRGFPREFRVLMYGALCFGVLKGCVLGVS